MALDGYETALAIGVQILPAISNVGLIQYEMGEIDSAIARWQRVAELESENAGDQMAIAFGFYKKGEQEKALHNATKAIQLDPKIAERRIALFLQSEWNC